MAVFATYIQNFTLAKASDRSAGVESNFSTGPSHWFPAGLLSDAGDASCPDRWLS